MSLTDVEKAIQVGNGKTDGKDVPDLAAAVTPDDVSSTESDKIPLKSEMGMSGIAYGVADVPPWYLSILLGFQVN